MNLNNYLQKGIDFTTYNAHTQEAIASDGDLNGMRHYIELNAKRTKRIYKTFKLNEAQKAELKKLEKPFNILVISEQWCGDASQILPILDMMLQEVNVGGAKIVYRDKNMELMEEFHTNGSNAIPVIIGINESGEDFFRFGPRPSFGMELLAKHKANPAAYPKDKFYMDLQKTYNTDKGQTIFAELLHNFKKA